MKKKILIVITKMYLGGFSKSLINFLLCATNNNQFDFTLLMLETEASELDYDIPSNVKIIRINPKYTKNNLRNQLLVSYHRYKYSVLEKTSQFFCGKSVNEKYLIEYAQIKKKVKAKSLSADFSFTKGYDCIVSWEEGYCNYVLSEKIPDNFKIGFIHPNYLEANFCKKVDMSVIKKLNYIITISNSCYETLCNVFPEYKSKIVYLPNRLNRNMLYVKSQEYAPDINKEVFTISTVARVVDHDKAMFRIVELVKKLKCDGFKFQWIVIGDGCDLELMRSKIKENGLEEFLICKGGLANPYPYMAESDLFVMQSYREGRPVAVDESIVLGVPALITTYSSAYEQIEEDVTGWIVQNDYNAIYHKLKELLLNTEICKNLRKKMRTMNLDLFEDCQGYYNLFEQ